MKRDDLLARLESLRPLLNRRGVTRIRVFGSHARNEAGPDSDIDLVADFGHQPSLLELVGLEQELSRELGARVDLASSAGLKPRARAHIDAEAIDA